MTGTHYCPTCVSRWGVDLNESDATCWRCGGKRVLPALDPSQVKLAEYPPVTEETIKAVELLSASWPMGPIVYGRGRLKVIE